MNIPSKEEIENTLHEKAMEKLSFIYEAVGMIKRRFHAGSAATKVKVGQTAGQKAANSGIASQTMRERRALKSMKTKKKKYGAVLTTKMKTKIARAIAKRSD